ncbi:hypothetical protein SG0102_19140 [Intestinibaculum porci]|uniref:Uncharacterized protein n=1 Tax=Intestinibaculum porci TaxID=2487118 RepID=A0A3G9J7E4_9FIRM|nr:hypothetical protein SG0102_19140 [Intestinibaculum porci]
MIEFTLEISNWNFENQLTLHVFLRAGGVKGFSGLGKNGRMSCGGEPEYAEIFCEKQSNS